MKDTVFKRVAAGLFASLFLVSAVFIYNSAVLPGEMFIYETVPFYNYNVNNTVTDLFSLDKDKPETRAAEPAYAEVVSLTNDAASFGTLIGTGDVEFETGDTSEESAGDDHYADRHNETAQDMDAPPANKAVFDFDYLVSNIYSIERNQRGEKVTDMTPDLFDAEIFFSLAQTIDINGSEPKVLIFSTHSTEMFRDSNPSDPYEGVLGLGKRLKEILYEKYGIVSIHHTGRFDVVDNASQLQGAYDRSEDAVLKILAENPSIEIVIDIHRDGVADSVRLVTDIGGKRTAMLMFVNGLSAQYQNGRLTPVSYLPNPFQRENLAFSFNMQVAASEMYPGLMRKIYLKPYRYSLHMSPMSLLVEVGAQTNTLSEALNAIDCFADILASVLLRN